MMMVHQKQELESRLVVVLVASINLLTACRQLLTTYFVVVVRVNLCICVESTKPCLLFSYMTRSNCTINILQSFVEYYDKIQSRIDPMYSSVDDFLA